MLELTPPLEHGSDRLAVHIIEPGGTLWLSRMDHRRFGILLIPPGQRRRLGRLLVVTPMGQPLRLRRDPGLGMRVQRLTVEVDDRVRLARALLELERFETHPDLPEWRERGYQTPEEINAMIAALPEWFAGLEEGEPQ